jgi:hypothetical protein
MPTSSGPNTLGESNLVFAYDTGDVSNSYIGQPTTNVEASNIDTTFESLSDDDDAGFNNQLGSGNYLGVTSTIGYRSSKSLRINRGTGGSGRIYKTYPVSTGEYSTVSAWVYSTVAGPFLALEYNGGDYSWGVSYTNNTHTGKGWERLFVRTNGSATSNTTAYYFLYTSVENTDIFLDNIQTEKKQYPTTFVNGTRSTTQGLLPVIGNSTLDLTNVSFDSNAQIVFDGTNDYIETNNTSLISGTNPFTIESITNLTGGAYGAILNNFGPSYGTGLWWATAGLYIQGSVYHTDYSTTMLGWHHSAVTRDSGGNVKLYRDGVLVNTGTLTASVPTNVNWRIGADVNGAGEALAGNIPVVKVYNKALTAQEVKQNYQQYKTRFNLS